MGWKSCVIQGKGKVSIELGAIGKGSAINGLDSFTLLASSHIDYSKVDPGISDMAYFLPKQGITCIKSYFINVSGSFKCYLSN